MTRPLSRALRHNLWEWSTVLLLRNNDSPAFQGIETICSPFIATSLAFVTMTRPLSRALRQHSHSIVIIFNINVTMTRPLSRALRPGPGHLKGQSLFVTMTRPLSRALRQYILGNLAYHDDSEVTMTRPLSRALRQYLFQSPRSSAPIVTMTRPLSRALRQVWQGNTPGLLLIVTMTRPLSRALRQFKIFTRSAPR